MTFDYSKLYARIVENLLLNIIFLKRFIYLKEQYILSLKSIFLGKPMR